MGGALALSVLCASVSATPPVALAQSRVSARPARAEAPSSSAQPAGGAPRAPSGAPLSAPSAGAGGSNAAGTSEALEGEAGSPQGQADPLVSNGLGSPSCQGTTELELAAADRQHCESSGFLVSSAPTGNFGVDVHIDTGVLGIGSNWLSSAIQDLVITPIWMGLVWAVHALVVMLEWCFTIDLLPSAQAGGLGSGLRRMESTFTRPWLALALAVASVLALYHGLIRRRVAETLGEALLMVAMMLGGLWVISDPSGTLGALGSWANQAALGTLAVAAQGTPSYPERTFGVGLDSLFGAAIEAPWCYLEFGDVAWCREPARIDPRLHSAALKIAAGELAQVGCKGGSFPETCVPVSSEAAKTLEHSAEMLRGAQSNGAIFLALPPNGPARNSINTQGSLLRTICQSADATNCRGRDAAPAEFRTAPQTWSRLGGLLLIVAGSLGMLLLLGFLALRLLAAALFSLLYLLLAPAMVLVPAFGEEGRALFRRWAVQLLGTVVAKLLFSFLLGVVFALVAVISNLTALGWWTQWLLMSALWWGAYLRRHQALGVAAGALGREPVQRRSIASRMGSVLETGGRTAVDRWMGSRRPRRPAPAVGLPRSRAGGGGGSYVRTEPAGGSTPARADHARTPPAAENASAAEKVSAAEKIRRVGRRAMGDAAGSSSARLDQLERVRMARRHAEAGGDVRRAVELRVRAQRIEDELAREAASSASSGVISGDGVGREGSATRGRSSRERPRGPGVPLAQGAQGAQGGRGARGAGGAGRAQPTDRGGGYGALSELAGYSRVEYERLGGRSQRQARLAIDRELAARKERSEAARVLRRPTAGEGERVSTGPDSTARVHGGEAIPRRDRAVESSVMRDAREVEAGRKRQLGLGRP